MDPHPRPFSANWHPGKRLYNCFFASGKHTAHFKLGEVCFVDPVPGQIAHIGQTEAFAPHDAVVDRVRLLIHRFHGLWENRSSTGPAARSLGKIPGQRVGGPSTHPGRSYKLLRTMSSIRPGLSRFRMPCLMMGRQAAAIYRGSDSNLTTTIMIPRGWSHRLSPPEHFM